jgi:hypothetical protein
LLKRRCDRTPGAERTKGIFKPRGDDGAAAAGGLGWFAPPEDTAISAGSPSWFAVCRATWARVNIDPFRHWALQTGWGHSIGYL